MKSFLLDPFLSLLFPVDIQPTLFSVYTEQDYVYRRQSNVSGISNFITSVVQGRSTYSVIVRPLKYFVDQNVVALATADLAVNTIIFAGNSLAADDVQTVQSYASTLTANGNTLTVVLMDPSIDQTNYRQVIGLNIVVWSNPATTITAIRAVMNCGPLPSTTTGMTTSTATSPPIPMCKSYIPFSFDVATDLTAAQFAELKTFLVNPFLEQLFPLDVQPAVFSTYDTTNQGYARPNNVSNIVNNVQNATQSTATTSDFIQPLQYFVDENVADLGYSNGLPVNTIIFAGSPLTGVDDANFFAPTLTTNGDTLTVVLVNPNVDQTNYRQVPGLNIVVWSDPATTLVAIKNVMNCGYPPSTTSSTTASAVVPVSVCKSYIPFSFDVATDLTASEYANLKNFLIDPFLEQLFPVDVQPAVFSSYSNVNNGYRRQNNVSSVIQIVQSTAQRFSITSNFNKPLQYFVDENVADLGSANGLPVNTIIFAGSPLTDVASANFSAPLLTSNGNTLTVVLMDPNIDQTNYRQVTGLNIVVWSDPTTTIAAIRDVMNCEPLP
uniref:Uncharacterized protein n=1 Tax=Panagrolaimus sp. JU765 TaxID=591449 RepID=A0AC34R3U3_9BILA